MSLKHLFLGLSLLIALAVSAEEVRKSMIAIVPGRDSSNDKPIAPPKTEIQEIRAIDWVNAWQAVKDSSPDLTKIVIQLRDRSLPTLKGNNIAGCLTLRASGELLTITVNKTANTEEASYVVRAGDMLIIEVSKAKEE